MFSSEEEVRIEDADVLYAGGSSTEMREEVPDRLRERDLSVADLEPEDLDELAPDVLEGKTIFYRDKLFLDNLNDEEKLRAYLNLQRIDESGANFVNSAQGSIKSNHKDRFKEEVKGALDELWFADARLPDTYSSVDEIDDFLDEDDYVVEKPNNGSLGENIEFRKAGEIEDMKDGFNYEEFISHEAKEEKKWEEVVDSRIWVVGDTIEVVDRDTDEEEPAATNLSQGGFYREETMDYDIREAEVAAKVSDKVDMDVFAIDCIRRKTADGFKEIIPYEANSTAGTQVYEHESFEMDLYEEIADTIEEEHSENASLEKESSDIDGSVSMEDYEEEQVARASV